MKPALLTVGIALIIVGGLILVGSEEIWRLYYDGPETCTPPSYPVDNVPTCATIDAEIDAFALVGILFFVVAGIVLYLGRGKS